MRAASVCARALSRPHLLVVTPAKHPPVVGHGDAVSVATRQRHDAHGREKPRLQRRRRVRRAPGVAHATSGRRRRPGADAKLPVAVAAERPDLVAMTQAVQHISLDE